MRAVFDTVVFVRALMSPYGLWGKIVFDYSERYTLVLSEPIMREALEVLHRPGIVRNYRAVATRDLVAIVERLAALEVVEPVAIPPTSRDPKDDKFLATARAARADYLVSEDADLTDLQEYEGTRIVDGLTFLEILDRGE
jgi:putative PIN family toxin of toxin-antitoxin system